MYPQPQQLVGYIDSQLLYGVAATYIRQSLLYAGWPLAVVDTSINQELAHTAHVLPIPLDTNAYYSSIAPQYYVPQSPAMPIQWQAFPIGPTAAVNLQHDTPNLFAAGHRAFIRFVVMSIVAASIVLMPVVFGGSWLLFIALTSGSFGINALAPYVLVCTFAWTALLLARFASAPFIAALKPATTLRQVLDFCWNKGR